MFGPSKTMLEARIKCLEMKVKTQELQINGLMTVMAKSTEALKDLNLTVTRVVTNQITGSPTGGRS